LWLLVLAVLGATEAGTAAVREDVGLQAAQPGQSGPQGGTAFDATVELVTLSVSVLDEDGVPIADLTPADFVIFEDGKRHEAALVMKPGSTPLDIALIVDLSNSMQVSDWRDRASDFLASLSQSDCAFLLGFRPKSAAPRGAAPTTRSFTTRSPMPMHSGAPRCSTPY